VSAAAADPAPGADAVHRDGAGPTQCEADSTPPEIAAPPASAGQVLALQRLIGNQAVARMFSAGRTHSAHAPPCTSLQSQAAGGTANVPLTDR